MLYEFFVNLNFNFFPLRLIRVFNANNSYDNYIFINKQLSKQMKLDTIKPK